MWSSTILGSSPPTGTGPAPGSGSGRSILPRLCLLLLLAPATVYAACTQCKHFNITVFEDIIMREFLFMAGCEGCVDVKVYVSDVPPGSSELEGGVLDPANWKKMCEGRVLGMGTTNHTTVPSSMCSPRALAAGEDQYFYISTNEVEPATTDCVEGGTSYDQLTAEYDLGLGFCPAGPSAVLGLPETTPAPQSSSPTSAPRSSSPTSAPQPELAAQAEEAAAAPPPTSAPISSSPTSAPISSSPTAAPAPTSSRPTATPTTWAPTVSKAPNTPRPTRAPNTMAPTSSVRYRINAFASGTAEGNVDPAEPMNVGPGTDVTVSFYPHYCLAPDAAATGILYGHFDSDYYVFPNNDPSNPDYVPLPPIFKEGGDTPEGRGGSFSFPGGTDAHDHEYDEDCDCVFVDFFIPTASMDPLGQFIRDDQLFVITHVNADINSAGFLSINKPSPGFLDHDPRSYIPAPVYDDISYKDLQVYSLGSHPDKPWVETLWGLQMGYKKDAIARGPGGILPTNTGDMKGNVIGQHGEWRNGAQTFQLVEVKDVDPRDGTGSHLACTLEPIWSNASAPAEKTGRTDGRSTHGPAVSCEPGYTVLYESTLFWHWGGGCDSGGPSYHDSSWTEEYLKYFSSDCYTGNNDLDEVCSGVSKLCYVLVNNVPYQLPPNQAYITLEGVSSDYDIEAVFALYQEECPEVPITNPPTVSSAPSVSPRPTPVPTISMPPSVSQAPSNPPTSRFLVEMAEVDMTNPNDPGRCWRYAHTFSCYPDPAMSCDRVLGDDALLISDPHRNSGDLTMVTGLGDPAWDKCCLEKDPDGVAYTWDRPEMTDAPPDCVTIEVLPVLGAAMMEAGGVCTDHTAIIDAAGDVLSGATVTLDTETYPNSFAVKLSINTGGMCSDCYLTRTTAYGYDAAKILEIEDVNKNPVYQANQCPSTRWDEMSMSVAESNNKDGKYVKDFTYVFEGEQPRYPIAFAAQVWCGALDPLVDPPKNLITGCTYDTEYVGKDKTFTAF